MNTGSVNRLSYAKHHFAKAMVLALLRIVLPDIVQNTSTSRCHLF